MSGFGSMPPYGDNTGSTPSSSGNDSFRDNSNSTNQGSNTSSGDSSGSSQSGSSGMNSGSSGSSSSRMTTAMFRDRDSAERAYDALHRRGYTKDDVNLLMSDETRKRHFGDESRGDSDLGDKAMEGAGIGSAIGGTVGAVVAAIAAIGTSVALPGLGLVIAGPLAASLVGAGAGGLTGGLVGALVGSGIPEERAKDYERGIKEGGIVMGVKHRNDEDAQYFEEEFRRHNGEHIYR